jgi:hypothetical protein
MEVLGAIELIIVVLDFFIKVNTVSADIKKCGIGARIAPFHAEVSHHRVGNKSLGYVTIDSSHVSVQVKHQQFVLDEVLVEGIRNHRLEIEVEGWVARRIRQLAKMSVTMWCGVKGW